MEPVYPVVVDSMVMNILLGCLVFSLFTAVISANLIGEIKLKPRYMAAITLTAVLVVIGSFATIMVFSIKETFNAGDAKKERIELMETTYNIPVSDEAFKELEYPSVQPEDGEFSSYGTTLITIEESGKVKQTQVTLLWTGKEFQLATNDTGSTELKELTRKN